MSRESRTGPRTRAELLRVGPGFKLLDSPTDATPGFDGNKAAGRAALAEGALLLADLQERLFAHHQTGDDGRRILLVLQAMDTAGKGGIVKHVIGTVDPQGVQLAAFKKPTEEELAQDFLWRVRKEVPEPGKIGVFDRSHYEDVLIARVRELATPEELERRYGAINEFEAELVDEGTTIIKVMLHISAAEQKTAAQPAEAAREAVEVQPERRGRAHARAEVPGGVPDRVRPHVDADRALVRDPGRPQVVRAARGAAPARRGAARRCSSSGRSPTTTSRHEKARLLAS